MTIFSLPHFVSLISHKVESDTNGSSNGQSYTCFSVFIHCSHSYGRMRTASSHSRRLNTMMSINHHGPLAPLRKVDHYRPLIGEQSEQKRTAPSSTYSFHAFIWLEPSSEWSHEWARSKSIIMKPATHTSDQINAFFFLRLRSLALSVGVPLDGAAGIYIMATTAGSIVDPWRITHHRHQVRNGSRKNESRLIHSQCTDGE